MSININIYNNNIATRLTKQINEMIKIYEGPRQSSSFETWAPNFIKTREYPVYHVKFKIFLIIFGQFVSSGLQKRWMLENMLETLEWKSVASRHSAQNGRVSTNWPHFLNREIQCVFLRLLLQKLKQTPTIRRYFSTYSFFLFFNSKKKLQ